MPPPALSPSGRVRSRTSDISDFLRGRHDPKTSTDLQSPPPLPHLTDPLTPPKQKSKFAFLARKRKSSFTPTKNAAAALAAVAVASGAPRTDNPSNGASPVPGCSQPSPAGPSGRKQSRDLPPLPPLSLIAPGYHPPSHDLSRLSAASSPPNSHIPHYAAQSTLAPIARKQKGSFESARRSTDSRSSVRPIITVSPPHSSFHEGADAYISPRTAPHPTGPPSPQRSDHTSLPTPGSSDRTTTGTPDSPTSVDIPTPSTSSHPVLPLPLTSPIDGILATATSYKEETLLRKDHFGFEASDVQPRRGTMSFSRNTHTIGFSPSRQERRHVSVLQLNRLKKEIIATAPKIRKVPSASESLADQNAQNASSLARSNTIASIRPQSQQSPQGSRSPTPQGRRIPPPLKRTWHTPPITGPPKEPLPSPPASATPIAPSPTRAGSSQSAPSPSSSPVSTRRTLPSIPKDMRAQGARSRDSLLSVSIPSSPARSDTDVPLIRTPVRENPVDKVLADDSATPSQLREALKIQNEKYARLSAYLLSLTERHAVEKAELMRKVDALEKNAVRCEREMKGLKWLVAHSGKHAHAPVHAPARADSHTLPGGGGRQAKAKSRDRSASVATTRSAVGSMRSVASESMGAEGRLSFDSPAGSVEEGLVELQSTISEFIAPIGGMPTGGEQQQQRPPSDAAVGRTRMRRSNTVPNGSGIPQLPFSPPSQTQTQTQTQTWVGASKQKQARRISSPVLSGSSSFAPSPPPPQRTGGAVSSSPATRAGLGLGLVPRDGSPPSSSLSRPSTPDSHSRADSHARCDSSTLATLPSFATIHSSSSASGLSLASIPETPRTDVDTALARAALDERSAKRGSVCVIGGGGGSPNLKRLSTSSASSSASVSVSASGSGSVGSSRVSTSPSIGQVLDLDRWRKRTPSSSSSGQQRQPEMEAILRRLRAFGHGHGHGHGQEYSP